VRLTGSGAQLIARARAIAAGHEPAAPLRPAVTLLMLADGASGPIVYLLRRRRSLAFAGGMLVFPGGAVEDRDCSFPADRLDAGGLERIADAFGADLAHARCRIVALVREVAEETGLLLTRGGPAARLLSDDERRALAEGDINLSDVIEQLQQPQAGPSDLAPESLVPWAHWVTPRFETRRFDAWFLATDVTGAPDLVADTGEADGGIWVTAEEVLRQQRQGEVRMLPPTIAALASLAEAGTVREALAHPPVVRRRAPGWVERDSSFQLILEDDPDYPGEDPKEGS
jgi:8-oxo-dGTP pyrophosphatase MutT (NUDIX family)